MYLFYVRHGNPCYNPDSLTKHGEREAEAVGRRLAKFGVDEIYSSDSIRARQTSIPLSELTHKEVKMLPWANESNTARYFYLNKDGFTQWVFFRPEFKKLFSSNEIKDLGDKWYLHPALKKLDIDKGVMLLNKNIDNFMLSLGYEHDLENRCFKVVSSSNKRIALFAHQGMGLYFLSYILDIPFPEFSIHFDMITSGLTCIEFKEEDNVVYPRICQFSSDAHLYAENLPTKYNDFRY